MKKKILIFIFCIITLFENISKSFGATTWTIDHFSDGASPEHALINRDGFPFGTGDILNFTNTSTMYATSSIGDIGPSSTSLTLNGNNKTIDGGNTYAGFSVVLGDTYTFNALNLDRFKNNNGGAIYDNRGTLIVNGCHYTGNSSTASIGGGVIYSTNTATTTISNSLFNQNSVVATAIGGGAFFGRGQVTLSNNNFTNNGLSGTTITAKGGAFYNDAFAGTTSNLTDNDFSNNVAVNGGAIFNSPNNSGTAHTIISGGEYKNNFATTFGGAIYNSTGRTEISGATFTNNGGTRTIGTNTYTTVSGGAIYNISDNSLSINLSSFNGNSAGKGGAIYDTAINTTSISGSNFKSNSATTNGGAIYANGPMNITDGSFGGANASDGNSAASGGAIYNDGTITISGGTTFTNNSATSNGGAIYNNSSKTIDLDAAKFTANKATSGLGGAVYNLGTVSNSTGNYLSNSASSGGAIYNSGTITTISGTFGGDNSSDGNTVTASGGAIYNAGSITTLSGTFKNNSAASGGAIYNNGTITNALSSGTSFTNNSATTGNGGAVFNNTGRTINLDGANFTTNRATNGSGGGLYNAGTTTISGATYSGNSASSGGAIFNSGTATITNSTFSNNSATSGGAICNSGTLNIRATAGNSTTFSTSTDSLYLTGGTVNLDADGTGVITFNGALGSSAKANTVNINSSASTGTMHFNNDLSTVTLNITNGTTNFGKSSIANVNADNVAFNITGGTQNFTNTTFKNGSRVYVNDATPTPSESTNFINTTFNGYSYAGSGAAIYNASGTVNISPTDISGFTSTGNGGAIYNAGTMVFSGGTYDNNTAVNGGAVYNSGTATFTNTSFTNNTATANGGAIYNLGTLYLKADGSQITLTGNTAGGISNGLYNHGTVYLNASNGGSIVFNDTVNSSDITTSTININAAIGPSPLTDGTVYFKNNITNSTINLYNGMIVIGNETYVSGNNLGVYDGIINTQNNHIGTMAYNNATFTGISDWLMDVDLANKIGDSITTTGTTSGTLNISSINLLSDASAVSTAVIIADANTKGHLSTSVTSINSALYSYAVSYDGAAGTLNFLKTGVSPNAVTSDVAQTSTFLLQTAIDRQFFGNVDAFMSFPLATRESTICCALAHDPTSGYTGGACPLSGNGTFSPIYSCDLNRGVWIKDFVSFENIPLRNGPNVSTVEYGTLIGGDAPLKDLGHGIAGNTSVFVGYLGSNQNYNQVGVSQNGVLVGAAENMVYKNTFLTLLGSVGSSLGNANTPYGTDHFSSLFAGAAAKGGYNFEFKDGEYIIQPNLMVAYTFTNTPDYTTASGINMSSKPLNAMQIAPGLRLIKNMREQKGQIYLVTNFVYNVMDNTRFTANDVQLPELSIAPYFEYGIGIQRVWRDRLIGFAQTLLRGGGRNGIAFQFGLRWAF